MVGTRRLYTRFMSKKTIVKKENVVYLVYVEEDYGQKAKQPIVGV